MDNKEKFYDMFGIEINVGDTVVHVCKGSSWVKCQMGSIVEMALLPVGWSGNYRPFVRISRSKSTPFGPSSGLTRWLMASRVILTGKKETGKVDGV
jgi:hypothetical protein